MSGVYRRGGGWIRTHGQFAIGARVTRVIDWDEPVGWRVDVVLPLWVYRIWWKRLYPKMEGKTRG